MAWTREFDTTYQTHYWYDSKTGESSWTEPPGWSEPSVEAENPETDRLTNKDDELELVDLGPRRRERSQDDSDDESDEDVEMLPSSRADAAAPGLRGDGADHAPVAVLLLLPREFL